MLLNGLDVSSTLSDRSLAQLNLEVYTTWSLNAPHRWSLGCCLRLGLRFLAVLEVTIVLVIVYVWLLKSIRFFLIWLLYFLLLPFSRSLRNKAILFVKPHSLW